MLKQTVLNNIIFYPMIVRVLLFSCLAFFTSISCAHEIEISGKNYAPVSVAINCLSAKNNYTIASSITSVIKNNLNNGYILRRAFRNNFI